MTSDQIRARLVEVIASIAPEIDASALDDAADLRDALDIDSMDFLNIVVGIDESLGVSIPERAYPQVRSLAALVTYVDASLREREVTRA